MFILLCLPSGCGHPFGSIVSFVTIDRERRFPLEVVSCTMSPPISGLCSRFPMSSVGLSGLLVAGDHAFTGLVTVLSSTLGPVVSLVFTLSPVSGRVCVLPQSAIVMLLSLRLVGLTFGLREGSPTSG